MTLQIDRSSQGQLFETKPSFAALTLYLPIWFLARQISLSKDKHA